MTRPVISMSWNTSLFDGMVRNLYIYWILSSIYFICLTIESDCYSLRVIDFGIDVSVIDRSSIKNMQQPAQWALNTEEEELCVTAVISARAQQFSLPLHKFQSSTQEALDTVCARRRPALYGTKKCPRVSMVSSFAWHQSKFARVVHSTQYRITYLPTCISPSSHSYLTFFVRRVSWIINQSIEGS